MSWKILLTRTVWLIESAFDRLRPNVPPEAGVIEPYVGYSTPQGLVARGRVLVSLKGATPKPNQSRLTNARQLLARFFTREVAGVTVTACGSGVTTRSNEEGYFTLNLPAGEHEGGWAEIEAEIGERGESRERLPVRVTGPDAIFGVISDIDDTVMRTGAYSLALNLWTTFTGNSMTREVFEDAVALMLRLHDGATRCSTSRRALGTFMISSRTCFPARVSCGGRSSCAIWASARASW